MSSYYKVWADQWCYDEYDDNYLMGTYRNLREAIAFIEKQTRDINSRLKEWDDDHIRRCDVYYEDADGRFGDYSYWIEKKEIPPVYLVWKVEPDEHNYAFETANKSLIGIFDTEGNARGFLNRGTDKNLEYNTETKVNDFESCYRYLMVHDGFGLPLIDYWIEEREVRNA